MVNLRVLSVPGDSAYSSWFVWTHEFSVIWAGLLAPAKSYYFEEVYLVVFFGVKSDSSEKLKLLTRKLVTF